MKSRRFSGVNVRPEKRPDDVGLNLKLARQKLEQAEDLRIQRSFDRAEKICVSLLKEYPDYYGAAHTLGLILADRGDHRKAVQFLTRAAILHPQSWITLSSLASAYLLLGSKELARKTALEALDIQPEKAVIHVLLGEIFLAQREYELARSSFAKGKKLDPNYLEAGLGYVRVCLDLGDHISAADELEHFTATRNREGFP